MTLKQLKDNMWIEVCEGETKPKNKQYQTPHNDKARTNNQRSIKGKST